jgi:hypothetical protein
MDGIERSGTRDERGIRAYVEAYVAGVLLRASWRG